MLAVIHSATLLGIRGRPVSVEVHVGPGLPSFTVVGQPDASCREARDRVRAAVLSSGLEWPNRKVTVNLAPSAVRKIGAGLDLAIAMGVLVATGIVPHAAVEAFGFLGELGLDGSVRAVPGSLPLVDALRGSEAVVPVASLEEARLVGRHQLRPVTRLDEVVRALDGTDEWPDVPPTPPPTPDPTRAPDLSDVRGQPMARMALEVAAAGGHHLLMIGPPGSGKTMLATRLPGVLPPLDRDMALDATRVHSAAAERLPPGGLVTRPPFRAPHHTTTTVALVGGGTSWVRPGEVSLAHGGVLFLDEMGEFPPTALDALRQPLEDGVIRVSRAVGTVTFPARFLLIGAMNPCPCGGGGGPGSCRCSDPARARYARRISGPILDRFDLRIDVHRPDSGQLLGGGVGEPSSEVRSRVLAVREVAGSRGVASNALIPPDRLEELVPLAAEATRVLQREIDGGRLSARGLQRVRCVARTVADLAGRDGPVGGADVRAALGLRTTPACFDRDRVSL